MCSTSLVKAFDGRVCELAHENHVIEFGLRHSIRDDLVSYKTLPDAVCSSSENEAERPMRFNWLALSLLHLLLLLLSYAGILCSTP